MDFAITPETLQNVKEVASSSPRAGGVFSALDPAGRLLPMVLHLAAERRFLIIVCTPNSLEFYSDFFLNSETS